MFSLLMKAVAVVMLFSSAAGAEVVSRSVEYRQGDTTLEGYLAWDDAITGRRPGILVVHEWTGINPYIRQRVEALAGMGYVAFAADIYGKGVRPAAPADAARTAGIYKNDRSLMRARVTAGLDTLKAQKNVDQARLAAIGYCFGGTTVLELARSGAPVAGTVSFHGGLSTPVPRDAGNIRGKVLALHGADDPFVKPDEVYAFQEEMRTANVDWQFISYGGAVHSFTNPGAGTDTSKGAAYNEKADRRSWTAMQQFLREVLQK